jgi:hypothetical protein
LESRDSNDSLVVGSSAHYELESTATEPVGSVGVPFGTLSDRIDRAADIDIQVLYLLQDAVTGLWESVRVQVNPVLDPKSVCDPLVLNRPIDSL